MRYEIVHDPTADAERPYALLDGGLVAMRSETPDEALAQVAEFVEEARDRVRAATAALGNARREVDEANADLLEEQEAYGALARAELARLRKEGAL
jgi:hypothetical protein